MRRVVVTGLGAVTPLGLDARSTWEAAVAGRSGVDWIRAFDATGYPVRIASEVKDFEPEAVVGPKDARRLERNVVLAVAAAREAWSDAGVEGVDPARAGILVGSAIGGVMGVLAQNEVLKERGYTRVSPWFLPNVLVDSASGQIAIDLGLRGPNYAPVSACATGSHAVGEGAELIRRGDADVVLAGGTESCMHPVILAGFTAMRGLVAEEDDPTRASRPFDATRAGFVMGEGACVLLLEDFERAEARGARMYAEVLGYGTSNDAHHMAQPDPASVGVAEMMRAALERAGVEPERVGYINAHGTSTPQGDLAETKAIKEVFGDHAYELAVSSTKSVLGHLFGAAGAVEAMMCVRALHEGVLPPTINYRTPDPECDLDYVPNEARQAQVDVALSNAMGLGGHNACVLVGRVDQAASRRHHRSRQLGERVESTIGERERVGGRRVAAVRDRDDAHAGRVRGADPVRRVLDRRAALGRDVEPSCSFEEDVRSGLSAFHLLGRHRRLEQRVQTGRRQHDVDQRPVGRRCEREPEHLRESPYAPRPRRRSAAARPRSGSCIRRTTSALISSGGSASPMTSCR